MVLEGFLLKGGLLHPRLRVVSQLSRLLHLDPINLLEDVPAAGYGRESKRDK